MLSTTDERLCVRQGVRTSFYSVLNNYKSTCEIVDYKACARI